MDNKRDKELSEELLKLERFLRKAILNSPAFKRLKKIGDKELEIQIVLMVMAKEVSKKRREKFQLSEKDKEFLKKHGIKW